MDKTTVIRLAGHDTEYRVDQAAYTRLAGYLDRAGARLHDDPDRAEVVADLERSIGDRLASLVGSSDRRVTAAEMDGILDDIGSVDTGRETPSSEGGTPPRRRLQRIREGEQIAGVCNGLAAYSQINVDWVRTIFFFAALITGGLFIIVYIIMAFVLPVASNDEPYR